MAEIEEQSNHRLRTPENKLTSIITVPIDGFRHNTWPAHRCICKLDRGDLMTQHRRRSPATGTTVKNIEYPLTVLSGLDANIIVSITIHIA